MRRNNGFVPKRPKKGKFKKKFKGKRKSSYQAKRGGISLR